MRNRELKIEYYKRFADELYIMYEAFVQSGFTEEQAFELVSVYSRQSSVESVIEELSKEARKLRGQQLYDKVFKDYIMNNKEKEEND